MQNVSPPQANGDFRTGSGANCCLHLAWANVIVEELNEPIASARGPCAQGCRAKFSLFIHFLNCGTKRASARMGVMSLCGQC